MRAPRPRPDRPVRVLTSYPVPGRRTNPYITQLDAALRSTPGLEVESFSWRAALTHSFDIFHVHWPHTLYEGRTGPRTLLNGLRATLLLLRLRLAGTAIVRTAHNLSSHEPPGGLARLVERWIDSLTVSVIRLNDHTPVPPGLAYVDIPHGHYRDWFAAAPAESSREPRRVLFFGLVRAYKGVEDLVAAVRAAPDADLELRIVGSPHDSTIADSLRAAADEDSRISCELSYLDDDHLAAEIRRAAIVVLPYRVMDNSGAVLLALSLGTPVLVPGSATTRDLSLEVGAGWVHLFDDALAASDLIATLAAATHTPPPEPPDLSRRGWDTVGSEHLRSYTAALRVRRGPRAAATGTAVEVIP